MLGKKKSEQPIQQMKSQSTKTKRKKSSGCNCGGRKTLMNK
ncbi:MAG TPA: hypothetical protein VNR61_15940 [Niallia sp.]|nr:hypothetical protein [Niallia sp.]